MLKSQSVNTRLAHGQYLLDFVSSVETKNTSRIGFADTGVSLSPNFDDSPKNISPLAGCALLIISNAVHDSE